MIQADALANAQPADRAPAAVPAARRRALQTLAAALANGELSLEDDSATTEQALLALPGIGPWTATQSATTTQSTHP